MAESHNPTTRDLTQELIAKSVKLSKTANDKYPSGSDHRFFSSYPAFHEQSKALSDKVLSTLNKLCNHLNPNEIKINLSDNGDYQKWQIISDAADHCIEMVDTSLDAMKQHTDNTSLLSRGITNSHSPYSANSSIKSNRLFNGQIQSNNQLEALYPQHAFLDLIDNKRNTPFRPNVLDHKHSSDFKLQLIGDDDDKYYAHPFQSEIESLEYPPKQLMHRMEIPSPPLESVSVYWIDTEEALEGMVALLSSCNAIAVDLEHHHQYTFGGMTCLMQISTRDRDYIIDTLSLRRQLHEYLWPIFTDPEVVKVFHGATQDIQWLQRDFSLYVVNLFDTFEAAQCLNLRRKSLLFLLETYCNVTTNKKLRMTDWRVRPLRPELVEYARIDTRYLLYLMDHFTNVLLEQSDSKRNLLTECYDRSSKTALICYRKKRFDPKGWMALCRSKGWYFVNPQSMNALQALYEWRDRIGRKLDQSVDAVLSHHTLKRIVMDLPQTIDAILDSKRYHLGIVARKYHQDIVDVIQQAVHKGEGGGDSIDPVFEVMADSQREGTPDLDELCCSNNGCFGALDLESDGTLKVKELKFTKTSHVSQLNMIANPKRKQSAKSKSISGSNPFFPRSVKGRSDSDASSQQIADQIFNDISNEPIIRQIRWDRIGSRNRSARNKKKEDKQEQNEKKEYRTMAEPDRRHHRIAGSKYTSDVVMKSKDGVFKLPRAQMKEKRKKQAKEDTTLKLLHSKVRKIEEAYGSVLADKILSRGDKAKANRRKAKMTDEEWQKEANERRRAGQMYAVENQWPFDEEGNKKVYDADGYRVKKKQRLDKRYARSEYGRMDADIAAIDRKSEFMTEEELLDKAPVPVLDAEFDNVYDPFTDSTKKKRNKYD